MSLKPPALFDVNGHSFTWIGRTPYLCRDKRIVELHVWLKQCECPGCGYQWTFQSLATFDEGEGPPANIDKAKKYRKEFRQNLCPDHSTSQIKTTPVRRDPPNKKLSDKDVEEIRKLKADGVSTSTVMLLYPISKVYVNMLARNARRAKKDTLNPDAG